jgi:cytochrome c-type biogenesis protein CcmE
MLHQIRINLSLCSVVAINICRGLKSIALKEAILLFVMSSRILYQRGKKKISVGDFYSLDLFVDWTYFDEKKNSKHWHFSVGNGIYDV